MLPVPDRTQAQMSHTTALSRDPAQIERRWLTARVAQPVDTPRLMRNLPRSGSFLLGLVSALSLTLAACGDETETPDLSTDSAVQLDQGPQPDLTPAPGDGGLAG